MSAAPELQNNGLHSVRSSIWDELRAQQFNKTDGPARKLGQIRRDLDGAGSDLNRLFERYESCRAALEEVGVVAQMKLSPLMEAAFGAWLRDRETPKRLELSQLPEAPIPPEGEA